MAYAGVVLSRQKHTPHVGVGMTKGEIKNRAKKMRENQTAKLEMVNALVEAGIFTIHWHPNFTMFEATINVNRAQYEEWLKKKRAKELEYKKDHLGREEIGPDTKEGTIVIDSFTDAEWEFVGWIKLVGDKDYAKIRSVETGTVRRLSVFAEPNTYRDLNRYYIKKEVNANEEVYSEGNS